MSKLKSAKLRFIDTLFKDTGSLSLGQLDALIEREAFARLEKRSAEPLESNPKPARVQAWRVRKVSPKKQD